MDSGLQKDHYKIDNAFLSIGRHGHNTALNKSAANRSTSNIDQEKQGDRRASPCLTPDGRRIQSALKRTGSSPTSLRKSVSFVIPNPDESDSENDDSAFPDHVDEVSIPIDAIAEAQKAARNSIPEGKRTPAVPVPSPTRMPATLQPSPVTSFPATQQQGTLNGYQLPSIKGEAMELNESNPPATFKSLRSKLRGMAPVRPRNELPQSDPFKICLHCQGSVASHAELKKVIDNAIHYFKNAKVTCLQFDPLGIWSGDPTALSRWVVSLSDLDACNYLARTGLNIAGEHYKVDSYDNVLFDEVQVYKMKQEIMNGGKRKI